MENNDYNDYLKEKVLEWLPPNRTVRGDDVAFRCPFCGDSKKSALKKRGHYSLSKGVFHCFNCDVSASALKLLQILSGSSFEDIKSEYIKMRLKSKGIPFSKKSFMQESTTSLSMLTNLKSIIKPGWKNPLTDDAKEYLSGRLVLDAPFLKDELYSVYDKDRNEYILIPWNINSVGSYYQLNDFKHLDKYGRKYIFPSKTEKTVYGLDNVDLSWNKLILFEGVYDSLFVKNGIAVGGKNITDNQLKIIQERYPKQELVIAFDNDEPGLTSAMNMIKKYPSKFRYFLWFDEDTKEKDINEFVKARNDPNYFSKPDVLDKMIVSSLEMKLFLVKKGLWKNDKNSSKKKVVFQKP